MRSAEGLLRDGHQQERQGLRILRPGDSGDVHVDPAESWVGGAHSEVNPGLAGVPSLPVQEQECHLAQGGGASHFTLPQLQDLQILRLRRTH